MSCRWKPWAAFLFTLLLAGCKSEATDFNNDLSGLHAELGDAVASFGETLSPLAKGETVSPSEIQSAYASLLRRVKAVRAKSKALKPPPVSGAEELYQAHRVFLEFQQTLVEQDLGGIARRAADETQNADALYQTLRTQMEALDEKEEEALAALHEAQRAFAKANGLRLGPLER